MKTYSEWFKVHFCPGCDRRLNFNVRLNNYGVCPYCGHRSAGTICDSYEKSARIVYDFTPYKWGFGFFGKNEETTEYK